MHRLLCFLLLLITVAAIRHSTGSIKKSKTQCKRRLVLPRAYRQFHSTEMVTYECDTREGVKHLIRANHSVDAQAVILRHASLEQMPLWHDTDTPPLATIRPGELPARPPGQLLYFDISHNALEALNFTHQPATVRRNLEYFDASWNRLDTLIVSDFIGMSKLKSLVLHHNSLDLADVAVFRGVPELLRLSLSHNPLRVLRSAWFQGLYQLQYVDLSNTQLKRIARDAFLSNRMLNHLDLSENLFISLGPEDFSGLESLSWLSLAGNRLEEVPTKTLRKLSALELLTLDGNRFTELVKGDLSHMNLSSVSLNRLPHLVLVQASAFLNLPRLRIVQMSNNERLRYIHPRAFTDVPLLSELYLQSNKLTFLAQELVERRSVNVSVYHNPFVCDCNIKWIVNLLTRPDPTPAALIAPIEAAPTPPSNNSAVVGPTSISANTTSGVSQGQGVLFLEGYKYECKMPGPERHLFLLSHVPPRLLRDRCAPQLFSLRKERRIIRDAGTSLRLLCWGTGLPRPRIGWVLPGNRRIFDTSSRPRRRRNGRKRGKLVPERRDEDDENIRGARITADSGGLTIRDLRVTDSGEYRCRGRAIGNLVGMRFIISVHADSFKLTLLGVTHNSIAVTWGGHPRRLQHLYKLGVRAFSEHHLTELQQLVILEPRMRSHTFAHLQPDSRYEICLQPLTSRSLNNKLHCLMADTAEAPTQMERTGIREIMRRSTVFLILGLVGSTAITICLIALFYKQLYRRYQSRKYYQRPIRSMRQELMVPLQTYNHSGSSEVIFDSRTSLITNEVKEF